MFAPDSYRHTHAGRRILTPVRIAANLVRDIARQLLRYAASPSTFRFIKCRQIGPTMRKIMPVAVMALAPLSVGGCAAIGVTAVGVGMATGVGHTLGGIVYKTFTAPQARVKKATLSALSRMQVKVVSAKRDGSTETIVGRAGDRDIDIELEALTPATTRMTVTAKQNGGILRDAATATEIILQTERLVGLS